LQVVSQSQGIQLQEAEELAAVLQADATRCKEEAFASRRGGAQQLPPRQQQVLKPPSGFVREEPVSEIVRDKDWCVRLGGKRVWGYR
jgi:hypothetical protein